MEHKDIIIGELVEEAGGDMEDGRLERLPKEDQERRCQVVKRGRGW